MTLDPDDGILVRLDRLHQLLDHTWQPGQPAWHLWAWDAPRPDEWPTRNQLRGHTGHPTPLAPDDRDPWTPASAYGTTGEHLDRIAWLIEHRWSDPIELDVGVPELGHQPGWPIIDGHHRLIAATVLDDDLILATASGSTRIIRWLAGGASVLAA